MPSLRLGRQPIILTLAFFTALTSSQAQLSVTRPKGRSNSILAVGNVNIGSVQQQSHDRIAQNSLGVQILREEAPMIRKIEIAMNEGRDMERNLTAIRDAIRDELASSKGIGHIRRIKVNRQLRELDLRINQLRIKNEMGEQKMHAFISGIESGQIRDRRSARGVLDNIYGFYRTVIVKLVILSRQLVFGVANFCQRFLFGVGHAISSLLGMKRRKFEAGINLLAGI